MSNAPANADLVRRAYEAFNTADMATLTEAFHQDATWHTPGRSPRAGDHKGAEAVFTQFGHYGGDTAGTFRAELQDVFTTEDGRVIGMHRNTGERNGKTLDVNCCLVFEFKDGKLVSGTEVFDDLYAWDGFWS